MLDKIYCPMKGTAIKITEVDDPMFSQKMLGDGVAVYPDFKKGLFVKNENIYSPCAGEVILVFAEKHAIGFRTKQGNEILIHMGIDSAELKGAPFHIICKPGDQVVAGQKIGEVNWKMIEKSGRDTVVPIIWTNNDGNKSLNILVNQGKVDENTVLFSI